MDRFFNTDAGVQTGSINSEEELLKALNAGYGTDSSQFAGGRAMIPEDIETTMIMAMQAQKEDCKFFNTVKKRPVRSTVHEYNRRNDAGDYENVTTIEGGASTNTSQDITRVTRQIKFLQTHRAVTDVMDVVGAFEDAFESEKLAGTLTILKAVEHLCFHGDSDVVPTEFDGAIKQITSLPDDERHVSDARGKSIAAIGDTAISDMVAEIYEAGGEANKIYFPPVLAMDIQALARDRLLLTTADRNMQPVFKDYPTPLGTISFGEEEGADKMFKVKGRVKPNGDPLKRPGTPTNIAVAVASNGSSKFVGTDAGNYNYTVHAVNLCGISIGKAIAAPVSVAAGEAVTLTITPDGDIPGTGFVICRSAKDGSDVMELVRVGNSGGATTTFTDLNDDLPGTAQILFITEKKLQPIVEFYQLLPLRLRPLYESQHAQKPFLIQLFGALDLKVPKWCGLLKNLQYRGGLY